MLSTNACSEVELPGQLETVKTAEFGRYWYLELGTMMACHRKQEHTVAMHNGAGSI